MAIDQISSGSPLDAYRRAAAAMHRSPDVTPDAPEIVAQESDARRVAESVSGASPAYLRGPDNQPVSAGVGTRSEVVTTAADPAGSLEQAGREIERAYASASPAAADQIAAEQAYQAQARARDDLALRAQAEGAKSLDITV
ncbi:MAG: hypothetical protein NTU62_03585 [Spirochaetes bacterium]|nr:hypothetical protein [Spirochaetota bacterium]